MAGLWKTIEGGFGSKVDTRTLESALRHATHSDKADVSKDDLLAISQSSHHEDDRRLIMRHLSVCLCDTSSSKWKRVNAALTVVHNLLRTGSPELIVETASGAHFDLIQRLSFLEKFEYSFDKRIEKLIRGKAALLRGFWLETQQKKLLEIEETKAAKWKPTVFHTDDTDEDLSDDEAGKVSADGRMYVAEVSTTEDESSLDGLLDMQTPRSDEDSITAPDKGSVDLLCMPDTPKANGATIDFVGFDNDHQAPNSSVTVASTAQESFLLDLM